MTPTYKMMIDRVVHSPNLILVVEDDQLIRKQLETALPLYGYTVIAADSAERAQDILENTTPDVILCDIRLPGMWGTDFKRSIEHDELLSSIPFVFLSALSGVYHIREGLNAAADDYVTKPFRLEELVRVLEMRMSKCRSRKLQNERKIGQLVESLQLMFPHEIVTPLSVIMGMSEFLAVLENEGSTDSNTRKELLSSINQAAARLRKLTERFGLAVRSGVGSLENGESVLEEQYEYDISSHLSVTLDRIAEETKKHVDLVKELESWQCNISKGVLEKIIEELVENAMKFSEPGSDVLIRGRKEEDHYRLEISDKGPGMTRAQMSEIGSFRQFLRKKREQQGVGLGLVIATRLSEMIGARLQFSEGETNGLTVGLILPLDRDERLTSKGS